jgi:hypothetical protein
MIPDVPYVELKTDFWNIPNLKACFGCENMVEIPFVKFSPTLAAIHQIQITGFC